MGTVTVRAYGEGDRAREGASLDEVSDLLALRGAIVWVDLDDPSPEDMDVLAEELGLHHLAVEDALEPHQRDKYVHYEDHLFLVCHAVRLDVEPAALHIDEVDAFIGDRWFVTVHRGQRALLERACARWTRGQELAKHGVGFLVYGLLDVVLDGYGDTIEVLEQYYDAKADRVFGDEPLEPAELRQWFDMRRALNTFRRTVSPLTEALESIADRDVERFAPSVAPYLRDIASEIKRVASEVEALRDLVGQIVEVNITLRDYHQTLRDYGQNLIVKKVTSWAAIIAVPTLVTGYYGMNVPYPGSGETWGVVVATAVSVGAAGALYAMFRRKNWL